MSTPLKDALAGRGIRLIQYGDSSVGKTVRASEAARWGHVEIHDFDEQTSNLAAFLTEKDPKRMENISVISYRGLSDIEKVDKFFARLMELQKDSSKLATLVVDSYTALEAALLVQVLAEHNPDSKDYGKGRRDVSFSGQELIVPGTMDYHILGVSIFKLVRFLKNLPINVILNAHAAPPPEGRQGDAGTIFATGKAKRMLPTEFTDMHYLFKDSAGHYKVRAQTGGGYVAKTGLTKVPITGILSDSSLSVFDDRAIKK